MPIAYERDDSRRLITVTATEPYAVGDILSAIDRQAAEDTWGYAVLYDLRAVQVLTDAGAQRLVDRVKAVGGARQRGPVGMAIGTQAEQFRRGLQYSELTGKIADVEVLLTTAQLDDWLGRNARLRKV